MRAPDVSTEPNPNIRMELNENIRAESIAPESVARSPWNTLLPRSVQVSS
jgi:hypothetical protein